MLPRFFNIFLTCCNEFQYAREMSHPTIYSVFPSGDSHFPYLLKDFSSIWDPFLDYFTSIFAYFSSHFHFIFESILAQFPLPEASRGLQNRRFWEDDKTCQKCTDFEMPRRADFRSKTYQKIDRNSAEILYAFCIDFERQKDAENHPKIT